MSATTARPRVFADTSVLYGAALRDILIELALAEAIDLAWSPGVLDELGAVLVRERPDYTEVKALKLIAAMTQALPDALVVHPEVSEPCGLPDPNDEHVAFAARHGECGILLTFNVKDFPETAVGPIAVRHPDAFLLELVVAEPAALIGVVDQIRQHLTSPALGRAAYCDGLARAGLPQVA